MREISKQRLDSNMRLRSILSGPIETCRYDGCVRYKIRFLLECH